MVWEDDAIRAVEEMMGAIQVLHEKMDNLECAQLEMIDIFRHAAKRLWR